MKQFRDIIAIFLCSLLVAAPSSPAPQSPIKNLRIQGAATFDPGATLTIGQGSIIGLASGQSPTQAGTLTHVYLSVRTDNALGDHPGTGTITDPFDVGTEAKLDAKLLTFGTNYDIHLIGSGPFKTDVNHAWRVQDGWIIEGDGMWATTLQMTGVISGLLNKQVITGSASHVTLRKMTVDANWANLTGKTLAAGGEYNNIAQSVEIIGSYNLADEVRVIHSYGSSANGREVFDLNFSTGGSADGGHNEIRFCRAELPLGTYHSPWGIHGESSAHWCYDCFVHDCVAIGNKTGDVGHIGYISGGVNLSNVRNVFVYNNYFEDCRGSLYQDTGNYDGVYEWNNTAIRAFQASVIDSPGATIGRNVFWTGNHWSIQNRDTGASYAMIIKEHNTTNCTITGNDVFIDRTGSGLGTFWTLYGSGIQTGTVGDTHVNNPTVGEQPHALVGVNGTADLTPDPALTLYNNIRTDNNTTHSGMKTSVPVNDKDSSVVGSLRIQGTLAGAGTRYAYALAHDYTIQAGDFWEYEVYCDPSNPNFRPGTYLWSTNYINSPVVDQNGLLTDDNISSYAKGRWYARRLLLTPVAGTVVHYVRLGQGEATTSGTTTTYYRNIRIVNASDVTVAEYWTPNAKLATNFSVFGESGATNVSATPNFADTISGVPAEIVMSLDPPDGDPTHFYNGAGHLAATGVGNGDVVGPGSSVAHNMAGFADTTGKLLEDAGKNINASGDTLSAGMVPTMNSSTPGDWSFALPPGGGGGGTVTVFASGNLAGLFTTSVATATSSPTQSFAKVNFAAHKFYGNNTGSTAAPDAQTVNADDVGGLSLSATVNATDAGNITSGTLLAARLPAPTVSTLGGVEAFTPVTNQFLIGISAGGMPLAAQPSFGNISGSLDASKLTGTYPNLPLSNSTLAPSSSYTVDFNGPAYQFVNLSADTTFSTTNSAVGKSVTVIITGDASLRSFTFPGWIAMSAALPSNLAAGKKAVLGLTAIGSGDSNILATYQAQP